MRIMIHVRLTLARAIAALGCALALCCSVRAATMSPSGWVMSGGDKDYSLQAQGSVLDAQGAHVALTSRQPRTSPFGGSLSTVDAAPYRDHVVKLSALISTTDARDGAGLWLRADGPHGAVAFANSQTALVKGSAVSQWREIEIVVPHSAKLLVFGTLLEGDGHAVADHLLLARGDAIPRDSIVPAQTELDAAIKIVQDNALRASVIDWNTEIPTLHAQIGDGDESLDTYPLIRQLLASLQDHHSHFLSRAETDAVYSANAAVSLPDVEQQPDGVGYVALPGFNNSEKHHVDAYESRAWSGMSSIAAHVHGGWIVDLRNDTGGNMWPMLVALQPFLGERPLGYFKSGTGFSAPWQLQSVAAHGPIDLSQVRLAVLTGPRTASAGEAVVIALHGRPNTRFFGLPTAGVPTGNKVFKLPDGAAIAVTTSVELDRTKKEYDGAIQPDVAVDANDVKALSTAGNDATLAAAQKWLAGDSKP
jgi:carboxyl-terminal processing protease